MFREVEFSSVSPVIPLLDLDAALERHRRLGVSTELEEGPTTDSPTEAPCRFT